MESFFPNTNYIAIVPEFVPIGTNGMNGYTYYTIKRSFVDQVYWRLELTDLIEISKLYLDLLEYDKIQLYWKRARHTYFWDRGEG
jgi:hypothetical protein